MVSWFLDGAVSVKMSASGIAAMPKKKSAYTDQTQPPYFRLDAQQRHAYYDKAKQRLDELRAAAPPRMEFTTAETCAKNLARELALPSAVADAYDPESDFEQEFPATDSPAKRFQIFQNLTASWLGSKPLDIGPIRTLYFFDLFASSAYNPDLMDMGGFPVSPHATIPTRIVPFGGLPHTESNSTDWLKYDLYLTEALAGLGLSWTVVENAMTDAFFKALPHVYPPLLANVPKPLAFVLWKHDLERWRYFTRYGARIKAATGQLTRMLWKTPYGPEFQTTLTAIERIADTAPWTEAVKPHLDIADRLMERCANSSPIIKAVNIALDAAVWDGIRYQRITPEMPAFARHIYTQKNIDGGKRPEEYWMLLADIIYHLPIVRGLPALRKHLDTSPKFFSPQTANALRLSVTRQAKTVNVTSGKANFPSKHGGR